MCQIYECCICHTMKEMCYFYCSEECLKKGTEFFKIHGYTAHLGMKPRE